MKDEENNLKQFNPLKTIWFTPRETFNQLIESNSGHYEILWVMLYSLHIFVVRALGDENSQKAVLYPFNFLVFSTLFFNFVLNVFIWYMVGSVYQKAGGWLGSKEKSENIGSHIRLVMAWAYLPILVFLPYFIFEIYWFAPKLAVEGIEKAPFFKGIHLLSWGGYIWYWFILSQGFVAVFKFSLWRGFLTVILPYLIIGGFLGVFYTLSVWGFIY